jgi:hypothetical protein
MRNNRFPIVALIASLIVGMTSLYLKSVEGLAFASTLATAAGTAYQQIRD